MPHICHVYQLIHVQISDNYLSIYTSYELNAINSVTTNTSTHVFTLLAYAPYQTCLTSHTYASLQCYCTLHIDPTLHYIQVKNNTLQLFLPCYNHIFGNNKYAPQMPHMPITLCAHMRQLCQYIYFI